MRDLKIEGKIVIFNPHAISRVVHLALIKIASIYTVEKRNKKKNKNKTL